MNTNSLGTKGLRNKPGGWCLPISTRRRLAAGPAGHGEFAEAVAERLEGGLLRYSKRLELLELAKELGIERFQAALLIAQVQYRQGRLGPVAGAEPEGVRVGSGLPAANRRAEMFLKAAALFLIAALIDLIIVQAVFG